MGFPLSGQREVGHFGGSAMAISCDDGRSLPDRRLGGYLDGLRPVLRVRAIIRRVLADPFARAGIGRSGVTSDTGPSGRPASARTSDWIRLS